MALSSEHGMKDEFDRWLEEELGTGYVPFSAAPLPAGAPYRAGAYTADAGGRPRRHTVKAAMVIAAVAIGLMATTALAATAVTGSANPQAWGQYVRDAVTTCKSELGSGQHGIGQCVRAIAHQKGAQQRDQLSNGKGPNQARPTPKGHPSGSPAKPVITP
jgi:hypothetical protein